METALYSKLRKTIWQQIDFNQVFYRANHAAEIEVRGFLCHETTACASTKLTKACSFRRKGSLFFWALGATTTT